MCVCVEKVVNFVIYTHNVYRKPKYSEPNTESLYQSLGCILVYIKKRERFEEKIKGSMTRRLLFRTFCRSKQERESEYATLCIAHCAQHIISYITLIHSSLSRLYKSTLIHLYSMYTNNPIHTHTNTYTPLIHTHTHRA